jgi:phospholipase C
MSMNKIEHVVFLMLENRSFDSMLGWLYEKGHPAKNVPELRRGGRAYEGLQGINLQAYENVDATGTIKVSPIRGAKGLNVPNIAPGETFAQVTTQLFGKEHPGDQDKPTMKGYVRDYTDVMRRHLGYKEEEVKHYAEQVMQSYTPDQLPVLNGLAEHYAVCDMWFSSVPSQTNPNRAFAFCGTSMGLVDNGFLEEDPRRVPIEDYVKYKIGDDRFHAKTIFNALADDGKTTWKIFRQSGYLQKNIHTAVEALQGLRKISKFWLLAWTALETFLKSKNMSDKSFAYLKELSSSELVSDYTYRLFPEILKIKDADSHFTKLANLEDFHSAARAGQLPNFTYIQPEWTIGERGTGGKLGKDMLFHQGRDYHPPGNLDAGENLVKQIYKSLISNRAAWEKTLLIITFDEPIGSFDHIAPPAAIPPWGEGKEPAFKRQHNFGFDRYGGRVPMILVSPLVEKSTVFRSTTGVPFDHTSIIATILKWRGLENKDFGERTKQAPTFENIVSLSTPRTDERDVRFLKLFHKAGEPVRFYDRFYLRDAMGKYISGFQEDAVFPGSIFSEDPSFSEYFPTQGFVLPPSICSTQFYFQNANNRPDSGEISTAGGTEVRLIATDDALGSHTENGLGSYNVLGAWKDSRDCYYFNDYMEGDNATKETWIISTKGATLSFSSTGSLRFGDKVFLENKYFQGQRLCPDSWYKSYLTTKTGDDWWTIEPISDEISGPDSITLDNEYYLFHVKTGKYVTKVEKGAQWYPTFGSGNRVALKIKQTGYIGNGAHISGTFSPNVFDGMAIDLVSAKENLGSYDHLVAWNRKSLYYYQNDTAQVRHQSWMVSLVTGSGIVKSGSRVRLINEEYGQFMAPSGSYLTTVSKYSPDCDWVLEKA